MIIKSTTPDGSIKEFELKDKAITIGRSPEADIVILDERASRMHCGIRLWDGEYYVKDLQSKNGIYLNNEKVEMSKIKPGDKVRIGATILVLEDENAPGPDTVLNNVQEEMSHGKGYDTILREIVDDVDPPEAVTSPATLIQERARPAPSVKPEDGEGSETKPNPMPVIKPKRPMQIKIKRPPK